MLTIQLKEEPNKDLEETQLDESVEADDGVNTNKFNISSIFKKHYKKSRDNKSQKSTKAQAPPMTMMSQ